MKRFLLSVAALVVLASPAWAQQAVVAKYRALYPTPLSKEQTLALERSVAAEVHGGLLRKPDGQNCGGYACDIVCFSDSQLFDILGDAEGAATPSWNPTANPRGYHCELVTAPPPPSPSPLPPPPPPQPPPPTTDAPTAELQRAEVAALIEI